MGSVAVPVPSSLVRESFDELEKQRELISSCTTLWKELSDHFSSLDRALQARSESLASRREVLQASADRALAFLHRRELSIDASVDLAISKVDERLAAALRSRDAFDPASVEGDLPSQLRSLCRKMDHDGFFNLIAAKKKEIDVLRGELPAAFSECIDPAKFVVDAISVAFPVDRREVKVPNDLGWACVLMLESLAPVLADPELGESRPLVTRAVKERSGEMADAWKEGLDQEGGIEGAKPSSAHTFLQHLCTFGISAKKDKDLYRKLVLAFSWRKQMPKLAISVGLGDLMSGMIEELIGKGQYLDAINFAYEAGLQGKFPPIPLLKSLLKDSRNASSVTEDQNNNSSSTTYITNRKEQSVIRAVIKCIEERKLEADFPPDDLLKRLEQLEKAKVEKKKVSSTTVPATKRTRANNGGPMPPAKAGRLTNNPSYAYSSPTSVHLSYVHSPQHPYPATANTPYAPIRNVVHGSRSPPSIRDPYSPSSLYPLPYAPAPALYPSASAPYASAAAPPPYAAARLGYPPFGAYNNVPSPGHQRGYYR